MKRQRGPAVREILCSGLIVCTACSVWAEGFRNPPDGASTMGRGGLRFTRGDDPAVLNNNPANLMDLDRAQVMPSVTIGYARTEYTSPTGVRSETEDPWRMLPSVYAAWPCESDRYVFGIGLNVPYGQSTEWEAQSPFLQNASALAQAVPAYTADLAPPYFAQMSALNASPTVATRLSDTVSAGLALNLMWARLELRQRVPGTLTTPASEVRLEGDGYGIGARAGLTWNMTERQRLALVYKTPVDITYEGDSSLRTIPPVLSLEGDFETELRFPAEVGLGYGIEVTDRLRLEANVEWVEHSRNDAITIETTSSSTLPQDWDDVWVFGLGGDLRITETCVVRAGWLHMPTPVPRETMMTTLPEGDNDIVGIGVGWQGETQTLDLGYVHSIFDDRTVANNINPAVNGDYEFESHLMLLSYTRTL